MARKRGQPLEHVRREMEESLAQAVDQWQAIEADPSQQPVLRDHNMARRTP